MLEMQERSDPYRLTPCIVHPWSVLALPATALRSCLPYPRRRAQALTYHWLPNCLEAEDIDFELGLRYSPVVPRNLTQLSLTPKHGSRVAGHDGDVGVKRKSELFDP